MLFQGYIVILQVQATVSNPVWDNNLHKLISTTFRSDVRRAMSSWRTNVVDHALAPPSISEMEQVLVEGCRILAHTRPVRLTSDLSRSNDRHCHQQQQQQQQRCSTEMSAVQLHFRRFSRQCTDSTTSAATHCSAALAAAASAAAAAAAFCTVCHRLS